MALVDGDGAGIGSDVTASLTAPLETATLLLYLDTPLAMLTAEVCHPVSSSQTKRGGRPGLRREGRC